MESRKEECSMGKVKQRSERIEEEMSQDMKGMEWLEISTIRLHMAPGPAHVLVPWRLCLNSLTTSHWALNTHVKQANEEPSTRAQPAYKRLKLVASGGCEDLWKAFRKISTWGPRGIPAGSIEEHGRAQEAITTTTGLARRPRSWARIRTTGSGVGAVRCW